MRNAFIPRRLQDASFTKDVALSFINLQKRFPLPLGSLKKIAKRILKEEGRGLLKGEIAISFVTDALIRKLNKIYHQRDFPTDVLAFDNAKDDGPGGIFADIIISVDTAWRNAKIFKTSFGYELKLYLAHGLLHLLGYSHNLAKKRKLMQKKEFKYVNS